MVLLILFVSQLIQSQNIVKLVWEKHLYCEQFLKNLL